MPTNPVTLFRGNALLGSSPTTVYVTNKSLTSNVATLTATGTYSVGQIVTVSGVDSTFDGTHVICATGANTFSYAQSAANVTSAAVSPNGIAVIYGGTASGKTVTNKVVQNFIATLTTSSAHGFVVGDLVCVDIADTIYDNRQAVIYAVPSTTTFSYLVSTQTAATTAVTASTAAVGKYPPLYTVPASTTTVVTNVLVHNPTSSAQTFTLTFEVVAAPVQSQINAGSTQYIDLKQVLATTKNLVGSSSSPFVTLQVAGVAIT